MASWDELPPILCGDVAFAKGKVNGLGRFFKWVSSFAIRFGSSTAHDAESSIPAVRDAHANHVFTFASLRKLIRITGGRLHDYRIGEALGATGFTFNWLREQYQNDDNEVAVFRRTDLTFDERIRIAAGMAHLEGKTYGYGKIVAHSIDYALTVFWNGLGGRGDAYMARWLARSERYPICSWAVAYVYGDEKWAGKPFDVPMAMASPDCLWDEIVQSDGWVLVWATDELERLLTGEV